MRFVRGARALDLKPAPNQFFNVRLVEVGKAYVSPPWLVSFQDMLNLQQGASITIESRGLKIEGGVFFRKVYWQGELWFDINSDAWRPFWMEAFSEARRAFPDDYAS